MLRSPVGQTEKVATFLSTQIAAFMIDKLWRESHTYIYAAPTDDCQHDSRGPRETKHCRPGDPTVYYAYMIPDDMEMSMFPWVSVRKPQGYQKLGVFGHDLDLAKAMESSINAFYKNSSAPFAGADDLSQWVHSVFDQHDEAWGKEITYPGIFRLPVCYDPTGTQFVPEEKVWTDETSIWATSSKFGTMFPCSCGPNGAHTTGFRRYSRLDQVEKYRKWCSLPGAKGPQPGSGHDAIAKPKAMERHRAVAP